MNKVHLGIDKLGEILNPKIARDDLYRTSFLPRKSNGTLFSLKIGVQCKASGYFGYFIPCLCRSMISRTDNKRDFAK